VTAMIRTTMVCLALLVAPLAMGAPAKGKTGATTAAKATQVEVGETVSYEDLRLHVGQRVVVHTSLKTTRTGTLLKFSQIELTLSIETRDGTSELTIPKDTVASVTVLSEPPTK
jgi:hypothetical protein